MRLIEKNFLNEGVVGKGVGIDDESREQGESTNFFDFEKSFHALKSFAVDRLCLNAFQIAYVAAEIGIRALAER